MKKLRNSINVIFVLVLSVSFAYAGSTPEERWKGAKRILEQIYFVKGAEKKNIPAELNRLLSIAAFLDSAPKFKLGDKTELRMLRNNFYFGNLVADVLESGSYRMARDYLNQKAPYDPDNFEYVATSHKLLREAAKENYKFYTVKLISKGKNQHGIDTAGREVYMFLFFSKGNYFKGEIIAMK